MAQKSKKSKHPFFGDPLGKEKDFGFGVLRAQYGSAKNDLSAYIAGKLKLCARSELLLPAGVPDIYADPEVCWASYERARLPQQRDLAVLVTLYRPDATTLHDEWERARVFAREQFVRQRGLPTQVVLHAPALSGVGHDVHVHLVVSARQLRSIGWGQFATDMCRDEAQTVIHRAWLAHCRSWRQP